MFETLTQAAPDSILALMAEYRQDARPGKVDLGIGVYKARDGSTPIMRAVREAERRLYDGQTTKTYLGMAGDAAFNAAIIGLVFGATADRSHIRAAQTPGGTGALRVLADLLKLARPEATVWVPDPTWPNHLPILRSAGFQTKTYPYFDATTATVCFDNMISALKTVPADDIVLLHGCCHNPTGANISDDQWHELVPILSERKLFPFVDLAYQGFGDGLDADALGVRLMLGSVAEFVVASSCSKNFSVYRDRVGAAIIVAKSAGEADPAYSQLLSVARASYSMPPDHGAATVRLILEDTGLRADWQSELEAIRLRMLALRKGLAEALRRQSNSDRFDFVAHHRGMFSRLGLTRDQVERLRTEHAIYMVGDSRINVAGLPDDGLNDLAAKIVSVL